MAIKTLTSDQNYLLRNQTADIADSDGYLNDGANSLISIWGNFGGGTVTLQGSPDNGTTWIDLEISTGVAASFTVNSNISLSIWNKGFAIRAILTGSTSPNINVKAF